MLKLEQLAAVVVAAGLAIVSYLLFFSWAGGGGYEQRQQERPQATLIEPAGWNETTALESSAKDHV